MDLELSADQVDLRDGIRSLLEGRFDSERIRRGFDRELWDEVADAGTFSLLADGFSWSDAALVFEQFGEFCVPGPLVAGLLGAEIESGVVIGALEDPSDDAPFVVEHLAELDRLVVVADEGLTIADVGAVTPTAEAWPLDPLTPVFRLASPPSARPVGDAAAANAWRTRGAVLTAAYATGLAQRCTDLSVAYASEREQFGRPIGSFQAIKHLLADMLVRTEVARAAVYAAAANLDVPKVAGLDVAVSVAKHVAGEAAIANGRSATQVHGGMGFTWEVDVHLYLKRAWVLETHYGSAGKHADRVAASLTIGR